MAYRPGREHKEREKPEPLELITVTPEVSLRIWASRKADTITASPYLIFRPFPTRPHYFRRKNSVLGYQIEPMILGWLKVWQHFEAAKQDCPPMPDTAKALMIELQAAVDKALTEAPKPESE